MPLKNPFYVSSDIGASDDVVPPKGTRQERGLVAWESQLESKDDLSMPEEKRALKLYDLPLGMNLLRR